MKLRTTLLAVLTLGMATLCQAFDGEMNPDLAFRDLVAFSTSIVKATEGPATQAATHKVLGFPDTKLPTDFAPKLDGYTVKVVPIKKNDPVKKFTDISSITFTKIEGDKKKELIIDGIESEKTMDFKSIETDEFKQFLPKLVVTKNISVKDGKITSRTEERRERQPNGQVKVTKDTYKNEGKELEKSVQTLEGAPGPINSRNVNVYADLAAGFGFSSAQRTNYFTTALVDGAGAPITRDGKQVYRVAASTPQATVATALSGQFSFAFGEGRDGKDTVDRRLIPINKWGLTVGTGFTSTTSGALTLAPYAGLSLFLGDNDTFIFTAGVSWVPTTKLKGLTLGQEILTDQLSTYESFNKPTLFIGLTFRIGAKGDDNKKEEAKQGN